jgi:hypothetical protein
MNDEFGTTTEQTAPDIVNGNEGLEKGEPWTSGIKPAVMTYSAPYVPNKRRFNLHPKDSRK